jgi:hypothetical protein
MKRYYTSALFAFSAIGGVVTFLIASFFTEDIPTLVLFSAVATLLISIAVPTMFAIADRKFMPIISQIKEDKIIDERVHFVVGNELREGFMLTTKESLFVISIEDDKPVKMEIKRSEIKKVSISDGVYLNIFLGYDKCIRVFAGNCEDLSKRLRSAGFGN